MKTAVEPRIAGAFTSAARLAFTWGALVAAIVAFAGCRGTPLPEERRARQDFKTVSDTYRPSGERPPLPELGTNSAFRDFLTYALLNQPKIEAAYYDWAASLELVTVARSRPDPKLTFEADISDVVMAVMPGLMTDFPGPGKLKAAGGVAVAASEGGYFAFESSVLQAAYDLKKSAYELHFLDDRIRISRENLDLLSDLEQVARAQNDVGKVTLQDVLRAQIEQERTATELTNLLDSRLPLLASFKAALGIPASQPAPPLPQTVETTPLDLTTESFFAAALARNPGLKSLEADIRRAEAGWRLATKDRVPDFSAGIEADARAAPVFYRPQFSMTLPVWRDKIAADIAAAQAGRRAAGARLSAGQISLAVEFAEQSFACRESTRNLELLEQRLLPEAALSLQVARGAYLSSQLDFLTLMDAQRTLLGLQLAAVDARSERELALINISLLVLGRPPAGAPLLGNDNLPNAPSNPASPTR